jgi:hypothetical protein
MHGVKISLRHSRGEEVDSEVLWAGRTKAYSEGGFSSWLAVALSG